MKQKVNKKKIKRIMREEYNSRIRSLEEFVLISEISAIDKRGNFLLAKDLKVKHKDSGFEYTVSHLEGKGKDIVIHLRNPEVPRFTPSGAPGEHGGDALDSSNYLKLTIKEFQKDYKID